MIIQGATEHFSLTKKLQLIKIKKYLQFITLKRWIVPDGHFDYSFAYIYIINYWGLFIISNSQHGDTLIFSFAWKKQKR